MTKKEWLNLKQGDKVTFKTWKVVDGKPVDVFYEGYVTRINLNRSQVLVLFKSQFDSIDFERWFGRLGIEKTN